MKSIPLRHIKETQKEPSFSDNFIIRDIQVLLAGKDMVQELHRHDFFYVLALKKGTGSHEIDFIPCKVCDSSIFFMRPGQVHQLVLKAGSKGYLMQFREEFFLPRKVGNANLHLLKADRLQKLFSILAYIFQEYTDRQEKYLEVIKANMAVFFIELTRHQNPTPSKNINLYTQERLDAFMELLEIHAFNNKQVAHYAGMLNLSIYQLNSVTKTMLGKTCSELINEHIILEAKRQLLATSNQINQIADQLGYEDVSYFIRFFKRQTGHSPESFRHNFR